MFSTADSNLITTLAEANNLLIIQDLDGVCMGLVKDPLTRVLDPNYVRACERLRGEFFVLTNGEHIGRRGINQLVSGPWGLPGLGAGGVQWQTSFGEVSHPGVSQAELDFLRQTPIKMQARLHQRLSQPPYSINETDLQRLLGAAILNNPVSPTINTNCFYPYFASQPELYAALQHQVLELLNELLAEAKEHQLEDAFFIHLAPNLGREQGRERMKVATDQSPGTTDFQLMLRGAIKEVGVFYILNQYYFQLTGEFPLGEEFNVRDAPQNLDELVQMAVEHFDPRFMPTLVGVGDTITSERSPNNTRYLRGGSDRGFLSVIQKLGQRLQTPTQILFVDSSHGEVPRPRVDMEAIKNHEQHPEQPFPWQAVAGISDPEDPLQVNYVFPQGHTQYIEFFCTLSEQRTAWKTHT